MDRIVVIAANRSGTLKEVDRTNLLQLLQTGSVPYGRQEADLGRHVIAADGNGTL